jgi:hypothetical protein
MLFDLLFSPGPPKNADMPQPATAHASATGRAERSENRQKLHHSFAVQRS